MRAAPFVQVCVVLAMGICRGAAAQEPQSSRPRVSSNGRFSVRAYERAPKHCWLEVSREGEVTWESPRCFGTLDDFYFVSNDGERVWVIRALPELPKKRKAPFLKAVAQTKGAWLLKRPGTLLKTRTIGTFMKTARARSDAEALSSHFRWLHGAAGKLGKPPHSTLDNAVEFETLDGSVHRLRF